MIGGSAGSLDVLLKVLPEINTDISFAIIIVVHRKPGSDTLLNNLLQQRTKLPVKEVEEKEHVLPGHIYVAPSDYHLLIERNETFSLDRGEKVHYSRPSIDVAFESAADVFLQKLVGLLLSGANKDGVAGLKKIKEAGGRVYIQDPESAIVSTMPFEAVNEVAYDRVVAVAEMPKIINAL